MKLYLKNARVLSLANDRKVIWNKDERSLANVSISQKIFQILFPETFWASTQLMNKVGESRESSEPPVWQCFLA